MTLFYLHDEHILIIFSSSIFYSDIISYFLMEHSLKYNLLFIIPLGYIFWKSSILILQCQSFEFYICTCYMCVPKILSALPSLDPVPSTSAVCSISTALLPIASEIFDLFPSNIWTSSFILNLVAFLLELLFHKNLLLLIDHLIHNSTCISHWRRNKGSGLFLVGINANNANVLFSIFRGPFCLLDLCFTLLVGLSMLERGRSNKRTRSIKMS